MVFFGLKLTAKKYKMAKKNKQTNLLFFGDFGCTTGFGHVSKNLIDNWSNDSNLKITVFAINDFSEKPYNYKPNVFVIPALSTSESKKDVYCRLEFLNLLYQNDFDVVFCLNDIEIFNEMGEHLKNVKLAKKNENKPNFKSIVYFPIDSEPRPSDLNVLSFFDAVVTYTEYGKNSMKVLTSESNFKKIKVIPHGCNTTDFFPLSEEEKIQSKIDILGEERKDTFLFGTVNRNSARKDLASLIIGFAMFKHTNPDVDAALYLHSNPLDPMGINIPRLCERVGLDFDKDVITPKNFNENKGVSEEQLNRIYNAFDIFITTTTAEGWGLSICEAMATKTLVICPQHTSLPEITNYGENCISFKFSQRNVFVNDFEKIRFTTNPNEVTQVMGYAYNFKNEPDDLKEILNQKIESAFQRVKSLSWKNTASQFKSIIDKLS